jgi:predicted alpha/beta-fold hydrolase
VTPKLYNALSVEDFREPMQYVMDKYVKGKAYAVGCSMGANVLANYLGMYPNEGILSGAVCIQSGIKKWEGAEYFRTSLGGIYNRAMGSYQFKYLRANLELL